MQALATGDVFSIPIQCDNQRRFIQVDVSVYGQYLVAKKRLIVMM